MKVRCFGEAEDRMAGGVSALMSDIEVALAIAERLFQHFYVGECHSALSSIAGYLLDDQGKAVRHASAARDSYLMSQKPWYAAHHELVLAQDALNRGDFQDAERLARAGIEHGAGTLKPRTMAQLSSRLARAINGQPGRTAAFADASLAAATHWEGISEVVTLGHIFDAARAYADLGRHEEAMALFAQYMPRAEATYNPNRLVEVHEQYASSLRALGHAAS
jgi:tetratricopeptide (TPR) repeat protein